MFKRLGKILLGKNVTPINHPHTPIDVGSAGSNSTDDLKFSTLLFYLAFMRYNTNRGKWFGRPGDIKEANKQAKIYVGRSLTLPTFCFMLIDYA